MGFKIPRAGWFIALLVLVFAAVWGFLSLFHDPYADWLTVEVPRYAVAGGTLDVRITLGRVPEPSILVADLYFLAKNHTAIGGVGSVDPSPSVRSGGVYSFKYDVKEGEKLALVELVIYLSPNGRWRTRTHGASTQTIPVRRPGDHPGSPIFKKVRAFAMEIPPNPETPFQPGRRPAEPEVFRGTITPFRLALLALLASGGLVCAVNAVRRHSGRVPGTKGEWRLWFGASVVLFLALFWEAFHIAGRLSRLGRKLVVGLDVYYARQTYQKVIMGLIAALLAGLLILAARAIKKKRVSPYVTVVAALLVFYISGSFASALSFHYVDVLRGVSLAGISLVGAAKAISAVAVLVLGLLALRNE
jgi:hypothetical protein